MIRYTSFKQLSIEEFKTPFEKEIDSNNRWVILANSLPWDELANIYHKAMSPGKGAPGKDARLVIGALIVKHKLGFSGDETIQIIKENPYIQYFLGMKEFTNSPIFDSGLFTSILKRLGIDTFNQMQKEIIEKALNIQLKSKRNGLVIANRATDHFTNFSSNLRLLSDARILCEKILDTLCKEFNHRAMPTSYREKAFNEYTAAINGSNHTIKENKKAIGRQLSFLKRRIRSINKLIDTYLDKVDPDKFTVIKGAYPIPLNVSDLKRFWIIQHLYLQQQKMHKTGKKSCSDRIIDIDHPNLRLVLNTKAKFRILKTRVHLFQQFI
jgi:IS5 family transposase